jgi:lysophospholipase L1-like esterase
MYKYLIFLSIQLVTLYAPAQTPGNPTDTITQKSTIIMSGNSITFSGNWQQLLHRTDVGNWGIPGYTTEQISWTIKNYAKLQPTIVFMEGGINDLTLGITPQRVFKNYQRIIDTLLAYKIIPVIQSTIYQLNSPDGNQRVMQLNKLVSNYCKQKNIIYLNLNTVLSKNNTLIAEYTYDGTHLLPAGYQQWALLVQQVLQKLQL